MSKSIRLRFPGVEGKEVRVGHGARCVVLMVDRPVEATLISDHVMEMETGIVLMADEARALGRRLIQQANASERDG